MGEGGWLVLFLAGQRLAELAFAARNTARLRAAGAVEFGQSHYHLIVALHVFWPLALWLFGHDRPVDRFWLAAFVLLQAVRIWIIASLGRRWTTRVIVLPGVKPVETGPYRWLRHPNYLVVVLELAVVPLALDLPWLAVAFTLANAPLLYWRIQVENAALAWAASASGGSAASLANRDPRR